MGQTLTAAVTPPDATATYQWQKADEAEGSYSDIDGATGLTYEPVEEDIGKFIRVEATGTGDYNGTVVSSASSAIIAAE